MNFIKYFEAWTSEFSLPTVKEFLIAIKRKKISVDNTNIPVFGKDEFDSNIKYSFRSEITDLGNKYYDYAYVTLKDSKSNDYVLFFEDDKIVCCTKFQYSSFPICGIFLFEDLIVLFHRRYFSWSGPDSGHNYITLGVFNIYTNETISFILNSENWCNSVEGGEYEFGLIHKSKDDLEPKLVCRERSSGQHAEYSTTDRNNGSLKIVEPERKWRLSSQVWKKWPIETKETLNYGITEPQIYVTCEVCDGRATEDCGYCDGAGNIECFDCEGSGSCQDCEGDGKLECGYCDGEGEIECDNCDGDGKDGEEDCEDCGGRGKNTCGECEGEGGSECESCEGTGDCSSCYGSGSYECSSCDGSGSSDCEECEGEGTKPIDPEEEN